MPFDPLLPVDGSFVEAAELREQFTGLFDVIQSIPAGPPGTSITGAVVDSVITLGQAETATASASLEETVVHFIFSIPRGVDGSTGFTGPPFTNFVADPVTTLGPGANATFELSFDGAAMHMILGLPRGADGGAGEVSTVQLNSAIADAVAGTAQNPSDVAALGLTISDPPTQAEVQQLANKLEELLSALKRI